MIVYCDTSAVVKLILTEPETAAVRDYFEERMFHNDALVSSVLLETELRRAATRADVPQASATAVLDRSKIFDADRGTFVSAGLLPGSTLRSLDALHISAAMRVNADVMVSYDVRQIEAAEAVGLRTVSP